jgi:hypothetical protein
MMTPQNVQKAIREAYTAGATAEREHIVAAIHAHAKTMGEGGIPAHVAYAFTELVEGVAEMAGKLDTPTGEGS